ncbi:MAG: prolyl-tRNA synthetase associated domain-containing protein [Geminicoccaceae bacterium]
MSRDQLLARLDDMGVTWELHEHPAVYTVEEAQEHTSHLAGGHCKNLFLKDKKGGLWLATVSEARRVDLNGLSRALGAPRFSFGKPDLLMEALGVEPGSVTPLALVNDQGRRVRPVWDQSLLAHDRIACHPLVNTATLLIASTDLMRFVTALGHEPIRFDFDE